MPDYVATIIEIVVITLAVSFVLIIIGRYVYRRLHHLPTGECECCSNKGKTLVQQYHKKYRSK